MKKRQFTFNFKGGPITVWAITKEEAEILAKAEAIQKGWSYEILEPKDWRTKHPIELMYIDKALMVIIELEDTDTLDEQMDCIEALKKLRNKLKEKENAK